MNSIKRLSDLISKLPGLGPKSARRIVTYMLKSDKQYLSELSSLVATLKDEVKPCRCCGMWCEGEMCEICSSDKRERDKICIVEDSDDILSIESCGVYNGLYHVLGGRISPFNGIYPEHLSFASLRDRVDTGGISEIIIATNPNEEGDITAVYIKNLLGNHKDIKFTRLSSGIQCGGNIEYASQKALISSLVNRKDI